MKKYRYHGRSTDDFWKNIPNLFELAWSLKNGDVFVSCSEMVWSKVPEEMAKEVGTEKFLETS